MVLKRLWRAPRLIVERRHSPVSLIVIISFHNQIFEVDAQLRLRRIVVLPVGHNIITLRHIELVLNQDSALVNIKAVSHDLLLIHCDVVIAIAVMIVFHVLTECHVDLCVVRLHLDVGLILIAKVRLTDL
jgi:hypothetical protein